MAGKKTINPQGLPDNVIEMLSVADKRNGHTPGTMLALMQQETGGGQKYLEDPTTYHYGMNAEGKRVAPHTGKISTAFGPFGILESTAKDPGFGVAPLKDKSLTEQVRFASDYLKARGAANYGEGQKYAAQLQAKIPGAAVVAQATAPVAGPRTAPDLPTEVPMAQVAQAPVQGPVQAQAQVPVPQEPVPPQVMTAQGPDAWQEFLQASQSRAPAERVTPTQVASVMPGLRVPDFMSGIAAARQQPPFQILRAMKGWA